MSYEIFYNKQFIKVDEERVVPMIEIGSNNCYDLNNKRARGWHNSTAFNKDCNIITTNADLLAEIEQWRADKFKGQYVSEGEEPATEADFNKRFGWYASLAMYGKYTSTTSFGMFLSFFKLGIKNAKTIEELAEHGIQFYLTVSRYADLELLDKCSVEKRTVAQSVAFTSTEQMIEAIAEFEDYYRGQKISYYISTRSGYEIERMQKRERRAKKATLPAKKLKEVDEYYVLSLAGKTGFFVKNKKYSFSYALSARDGKKFATEAQAKKFHKLMKRSSYFTVQKIAEKTTILS